MPQLIQRFGGMGLGLFSVASGAAGLLCILPANIALNAVAAVAIGVALGAMNPMSSQILGPLASSRTAGLIMAVKQTGLPMGAMLAGALVPILVQHAGWDAAALYCALSGATIAIALLPTMQWLNRTNAAQPWAPRQPLEPVKRLLAMPGMWALVVAGAVFSIALVCFRSFLSSTW